MTEISRKQIKGLFYHLVQAVGKSTAAASFLGISEQRVRHLYNTQNDDLPTLMQIITLEAVCGQAIVTGALADLVQPDRKPKDPMQEAAEAVEHTVEVMHLVRRGASRREVEKATIRAIQELQDVPGAVPDDATSEEC